MEILNNFHAFIWREMGLNNCNTYFINGSKKIIIDPGHQQLFRHVKEGLTDINISIDQIDLVIITHGHPDHMEAVEVFEKSTLVAISNEEMEFFKTITERYRSSAEVNLLKPDLLLQEGEITVGNETFQILLAPGHSPGSICLYWPDKKVLITGDTIFNQGIGRTDLPGGNGKLLKESIKKLAALEVEYLLPGHGEIVTGKKSVDANFKIIETQWFGYLA